MTVSFRIIAARGLVYVRYEGQATAEETFQTFSDYIAHPEFRPGQRQLVDLSGVTGFDADYAALLAMQAKKADAFLIPGAETLLVYYAPTEPGYAMARMILRSWEDVDAVVALAQQDESQSLALLGQPERSFAELLQATS